MGADHVPGTEGFGEQALDTRFRSWVAPGPQVEPAWPALERFGLSLADPSIWAAPAVGGKLVRRVWQREERQLTPCSRDLGHLESLPDRVDQLVAVLVRERDPGHWSARRITLPDSGGEQAVGEDHVLGPQADGQLCFPGTTVRSKVDQAPARFRTELEGEAAKQQAAGRRPSRIGDQADGRVGRLGQGHAQVVGSCIQAPDHRPAEMAPSKELGRKGCAADEHLVAYSAAKQLSFGRDWG